MNGMMTEGPTVLGFEQCFDVMRYPAGESHVTMKLTPHPGDVIQVSHCRGFEDLCNVLTADDILRHNGVVGARWFIPYFPFGRHDRRRFRHDGLELARAMDMVAHLDVITMDPHSDVLGMKGHIPQSEVVDAFACDTDLFAGNPIVVIPDAGATKKAMMWIHQLSVGRTGTLDFVQAEKYRDVDTGELSGFGILELDELELQERPCVIVDDICDGGGTFIGLAKVLQEHSAGELRLAVSHGLFTQGTAKLFDYFTQIYSTGPHQDDGVTRIKQHEIFTRSLTI